MKTKLLFSALLIAALVGGVRADDERASRMLRKADEILREVKVVSNHAVGYAGECPEANWALSIVCASGDGAVDHLAALSERCKPAGFVMCLLGIRALDQKRFSVELERRRKEIIDAKLTVETAVGCKRRGGKCLKVPDRNVPMSWIVVECSSSPFG